MSEENQYDQTAFNDDGNPGAPSTFAVGFEYPKDEPDGHDGEGTLLGLNAAARATLAKLVATAKADAVRDFALKLDLCGPKSALASALVLQIRAGLHPGRSLIDLAEAHRLSKFSLYKKNRAMYPDGPPIHNEMTKEARRNMSAAYVPRKRRRKEKKISPAQLRERGQNSKEPAKIPSVEAQGVNGEARP